MVFVFLRASKMIGNCYSFYVICYMTLKVFMLQEIRGFFFFSPFIEACKMHTFVLYVNGFCYKFYVGYFP